MLDPAAHLPEDFFRPVKDPQVRTVTHANLWKSTRPHHDEPRRLLVRTIVTHLLASDGGFVLFHVDGDTRWSRAHTSENGRQFEDKVILPVRRTLGGHVPERERVEAAMQRLFLWMPHWSVESWLYQATEVAAHACRARGCGNHVGQIEAWGVDRTQLDEVDRPKEQVCFGGMANADLAKAFPAAEVDAAGTSFHAALASMRRCDAWLRALASARPAW